MRNTGKVLVLVTSVCLILFLFYCTGLGYYLKSETFQLLGGNNICEVPTRTEPTVSNNMSPTALVQLDENKNKIMFVKDFNLSDGHRLGNQMFRYASLLGIARAQGRELIVSSGSKLEKTFKLHHVKDNNASNEWPVIEEVTCYTFDRRLMDLPFTDMQIKGYLQSYKYFSNVADEVRQEFTFNDSIANEAAIILHDVYIRFKGSLVVGVHVRRGDFNSARNRLLGYKIPGKSFFRKAFNLLKSKFPGRNITFLVVSDDLPWCMTNLVGTSTIIAPPASPAVHIAVLAKCDHVIITSGTFSWWGGWLSGGYVVYFSGFMMKNTIIGNKFSSQDYYPSFWIGLGN